jgi:hypothetical protein
MSLLIQDHELQADVEQTTSAGPASAGLNHREPVPSRSAGVGGTVAGLLSALFMVLLWLPLAGSGLDLDPTPAPQENRKPAPFPHLEPGGRALKAYLAAVESYFNDHFGFRNALVRAHRHLKWRCFGEGSGDVLIGREHWLYYVGNHGLDCRLGVRSLNAQTLQEWQRTIERRRDWLAQRGMKYLFVVAPDKQSIYPEYLPEWARQPHRPTELDQLIGYLKTNSTVELLDLRPALLAARNEARVYLINDTHWNYLGAFAAYREIIGALKGQFPDLEPLPLEAFETNFTFRSSGDLAHMAALERSMPEPAYVTLRPRPPLPALAENTDLSILFKRWPPTQEPVHIENPAQKRKAVVFHDSFSMYLRPFLGYHFQRTVFVWQREWDKGLLERERPDVVIDEMVERFLDLPPPKDAGW